MSANRSVIRVFIVDDEAGMRLGARRALEKEVVALPDIQEEAVFEILDFESAEGAAPLLGAEPPDLLLLDSKLPGKSGQSLLEELHARQASFCTILITAYATLESAVRAVKLGAFDFLPKPFSPEELRGVVRKAARDILLTRKAAALTRERTRIRFDFISVLAHELKSPLNAVESYLDLIRNRQAGDRIEDYSAMFERIGARTQGMRKLILDLLDLTAIESGERKRVLKPLDLAAAVRALVDSFREEAGAAQVCLECEAPAALFKADPSDLEMILRNLVSNAIKYNRPGGKVTIAAMVRGPKAEIRVSDTGIGMTPEDQALLFREFTRIKNEKTAHITGSGLGLSIIRRVAALYKGDVTVRSEPDRGTVFTVTLHGD